MSVKPASLIDTHAAKRRRVPQASRRAQVLALQTTGMTQEEIAKQLGVSRSAITRDLQDLRAQQAALAVSLQDRVTSYIEHAMPIERRIDTYVKLAKNDRMPQYQQASAMRLDDMQGFVTIKDRKAQESPNTQPLITIEGVQINLGPVVQVRTVAKDDDGTPSTPIRH